MRVGSRAGVMNKPQREFYCPNCGHKFVVVFLDIEAFATAECSNCNGIALWIDDEVVGRKP